MRAWLMSLIGLAGCGSDDSGFVTFDGGSGGEGEGEGEGGGEGGGEGEGESEGEGEGEDVATETACDRFDDDGDGLVDEGCGCESGESQSCYPGDPATVLSAPCEWGIQICAGEESGEFNSWGECTGFVAPVPEICGNDVDDDCDGAQDDGCTCPLGDAETCYPGDPADVGIGACVGGSRTCVAGPEGSADNAWGDCEGFTLPSDEVCGNGLDDDCAGDGD
ncbi:MAG: hypothetical protein AABZ30_14475, partial [Myxococcota bacterium]